MTILTRIILIAFFAQQAWSASQNYCGPNSAIQAALLKAARETGPDRTDFEHNVIPFRLLRQRNPQDLFVHEHYQDAVQQHGIEGHLRALIEEYQTLQIENPEDWKYQYLFSRVLIGRNTQSAIQGMLEILRDHPDFAPAHRSLAEIYASEAFHDADKERIELDRSQTLCPGLVVTPRPDPLPDPSPLIDKAEHLLGGSGDPIQSVRMTNEAIRTDEWRLQRIRPFDWYSVEYKRQQQSDLQAEYWRVWGIQVRAYRKAQQAAQSEALVNAMEERATYLNTQTVSVQWSALMTLAHLYEEGKQPAQASQKLDAMRQLLVKHPDLSRTAQIDELQHKLQKN